MDQKVFLGYTTVVLCVALIAHFLQQTLFCAFALAIADRARGGVDARDACISITSVRWLASTALKDALRHSHIIQLLTAEPVFIIREGQQTLYTRKLSTVLDSDTLHGSSRASVLVLSV